jgi:hypothetical protein
MVRCGVVNFNLHVPVPRRLNYNLQIQLEKVNPIETLACPMDKY